MPILDKAQLADQECSWLREQIKALRRISNAIDRQIDVFETRIDDLRREQYGKEA